MLKFLLESRCLFDEKNYEAVSFDYKLTSEGQFWMNLISPDWGKYYDLALFLQVSMEEQQGRLLLRNGAKGMVPFLTRWIPREESYFKACDVKSLCDAVVDGEE